MSFLFDALTREECEAIREEDGYERGVREGRHEGELLGRREGELLGRREGELLGRREGELLGRREGRREGLRQGIFVLIEDNLEDGKSEAQILAKLQRRYGLPEDECKKYFEEFQANKDRNK